MKVKKHITNIMNNEFFVQKELRTVNDNKEEFNIVNVHPDIIYQDWLGLGGALTNSSVYNLKKLSDEKKEIFLEEYFYDLKYNFLRLPIGSTDFSVKSSKDYKEDFNDNVEIIKKIKEKKNIEIIATPWSPPARFKNNFLLYMGKLRKKHYNDFANYLIDFINDYKEKGIKVNYLSVQNEPFARQIWESCRYELDELKELIYNYVVPKLDETKIILWDHNKENLYNNFKALYEESSKVKGVGFHWYSGGFYEEMKIIKDKYPDILLFETEMCCGFSKYDKTDWINDAEHYLSEIINGLNNGLNAFIDWNLLLDYKGGPNHKKNYCKSPIILNEANNEYIKTPIYYYLKHIGMVDKAKVISSSNYMRDSSLEVVALKNDKLYVIILNKSNSKKEINIRINDNLIKDSIDKRSIITYEIND